MKETYIDVMHGLHGRIAAKIEAGEVRDDFAGLGLAQQGDGMLVKDGQSETIIKNLKTTRYLKEGSLSQSLVLSKGLVFEKTLFFNMLQRAGEFVAFRHINSKGETHSVPLKSKTETRKRTLSEIILHFLAATIIGVAIGWLIYLAEGDPLSSAWPWILTFTVIVPILYGLVFDLDRIKIAHVTDQWEQVKLSGDRSLAIKFLWPNGQDAEFDGNRAWGNESQVRCRVHFPERSAEVNKEIARVIAAGSAIGAKPLIVAHYKAVGIGESSVVPLPADPFICLETSSSVVVFPHTIFGEIAEEEDMIKRLKDSFASLSFQQQN